MQKNSNLYCFKPARYVNSGNYTLGDLSTVASQIIEAQKYVQQEQTTSTPLGKRLQFSEFESFYARTLVLRLWICRVKISVCHR